MKRNWSALIGIVCFLGLQGLAFAGGLQYTSTIDGLWSTAATWDRNAVPIAGVDFASIRNVVGVTTAAQGAAILTVGFFTAPPNGPGTLNISAGSLTISPGIMQLGAGDIGTVNLSGGTLTADRIIVGGINGSGFFSMSGGSLVVTTIEVPTAPPTNADSTFVVSGGALTLSGTATFGAFTGVGTLAIEGGIGSFEGSNSGIDGTVVFPSTGILIIRPDGPLPINLTRFDVGTVNIDTGATLEFDPLYTPEVGDNWFIFISQDVVGGSAAIFTNVVTPPGITISQSVAPTRGVPVGPEKLTVTVTAAPPPTAWVDFAWGGETDGSEAKPWGTLTKALANVGPGEVIKIKGDTATSATAETPTINQEVTIQAVNGMVTIGFVARDAERSGFVSRGKKGK